MEPESGSLVMTFAGMPSGALILLLLLMVMMVGMNASFTSTNQRDRTKEREPEIEEWKERGIWNFDFSSPFLPYVCEFHQH